LRRYPKRRQILDALVLASGEGKICFGVEGCVFVLAGAEAGVAGVVETDYTGSVRTKAML
jgi:hypothetical protein